MDADALVAASRRAGYDYPLAGARTQASEAWSAGAEKQSVTPAQLSSADCLDLGVRLANLARNRKGVGALRAGGLRCYVSNLLLLFTPCSEG